MTAADSWRRITDWCAVQAPRTAAAVRAPAVPAALAEVQARFPSPWPADLVEWYGLQDGAPTIDTLFRGLVTCWEILPLEQIIEHQQMYLDIAEDVDLDLDDRGSIDEAGQVVGGWLPEFVPIGSDGCGCELFVDLRPGAQHGCVTGFMREDADLSGPTWPSVAAMLDDLADALESGRPCDGWRANQVDGVLDWEPVD